MRAGRFAVLIMIISSFGPYLVGGIRTDQVVIYGLLGLVLIARRRVRATPLAQLTFATWLVYDLVAFVGAVSPVELISVFPRGSILSGLNHLTGPLAVMLIVWAFVPPQAANELLTAAARLIAFLMAGNAVIAFAMTRIDLEPFLRRFWAAAGPGDTVAQLAATMGRVPGIFNQPAEAGLAYGIAGLSACYVWRTQPNRLFLLLIPIILGGLLSISKVFILGGLPLILWSVWRSKVGRGRITLLMVGAAPLLGLAQSESANQWVVLQNLESYVNVSGSNILSTYTAGRMGSNASLTSLWDEVTRVDPWFGFGAGGIQVAYDNGWAEAYVMAGLVGMLCYTLTLLWLWQIARRIREPARRRFILGLVILAVGTSLGLPALTTNRASTFLWLLIALASLALVSRERPTSCTEVGHSTDQPLSATAENDTSQPVSLKARVSETFDPPVGNGDGAVGGRCQSLGESAAP
jgi:hypothetical protein